jgi:putative ABC transport system permease protein
MGLALRLLLGQAWSDTRLAVKGLGRTKAFALTAVLTLAVGIAATTVMFALIQGVLLRPLPVRDQDRLVVSWLENRAAALTHYPYRSAGVATFGRESRTFEAVAAVGYNGANQTIVFENGAPSYVSEALISGRAFEVLGTPAFLGRALNPGDDVDGAEPVVAITYALWMRRYGGARDIIGHRVSFGDRVFTIVGVMPPDLNYPRGVEVWRPIASVSPDSAFGWAARRDVDLIGRLRPGITMEQAAGELRALAVRVFTGEPGADAPSGLAPAVRRFADVMVSDVRPAMLILFGAVGLLLLIASANVANLLLFRGEGRRQELAVRAALGASRARLMWQLVTESLFLAVMASAIGLAVAAWSLQALVALVPDGLPRVDAVRIDAGVVAFTLAIAFLTAVGAGLAPALLTAGVDLVDALRSGTRGATPTTVRRGRRALVVVQVALAVIVVAAAGLLTRSVLRLQSVDMGLAADRLVFVDFSIPYRQYDDRNRRERFLDQLVQRLEAAPGIAAATPINVPPFAGTGGWDLPEFTADGQTSERAAANPSLNLESIHPNYFSTFEVALVRGRVFTRADRADAPPVAIVSEDVADRTWPGQDPIGRRLKFGGVASNDPWWTVVGVVRPTRYRDLFVPRPTLYVPAVQFQSGAGLMVLRTSAPLDIVSREARAAARTVDPQVQVVRVAPFATLLDGPLARPRFSALVIGIFGIAALLLAAIGLYGVMSTLVRQRHRELGVRIAIGATGSDVRRLVFGEGLGLAGAGIVAGLAITVLVTQTLRSLLFGVHPLDPVTLFATTMAIGAASLLASYLPARRATQVNPIELLRAE